MLRGQIDLCHRSDSRHRTDGYRNHGHLHRVSRADRLRARTDPGWQGARRQRQLHLYLGAERGAGRKPVPDNQYGAGAACYRSQRNIDAPLSAQTDGQGYGKRSGVPLLVGSLHPERLPRRSGHQRHQGRGDLGPDARPEPEADDQLCGQGGEDLPQHPCQRQQRRRLSGSAPLAYADALRIYLFQPEALPLGYGSERGARPFQLRGLLRCLRGRRAALRIRRSEILQALRNGEQPCVPDPDGCHEQCGQLLYPVCYHGRCSPGPIRR